MQSETIPACDGKNQYHRDSQPSAAARVAAAPPVRRNALPFACKRVTVFALLVNTPFGLKARYVID